MFDLLSSHVAQPPGTGTILNALDLPRPEANHFPTTFASDVEAFTSTIDMPTCGREIPYPSHSMKWGLAATTGAHHGWHIDCDGFGTVIEVKTGWKWWVVAQPRKPSDFASVSLFLEGFDIDKVNDNKWDLDAILLPPGSTL